MHHGDKGCKSSCCAETIKIKYISCSSLLSLVDIILYFPLFLGTVVYDNEFETKENKVNAKNKIEPQHTFSNLIHKYFCYSYMFFVICLSMDINFLGMAHQYPSNTPFTSDIQSQGKENVILFYLPLVAGT